MIPTQSLEMEEVTNLPSPLLSGQELRKWRNEHKKADFPYVSFWDLRAPDIVFTIVVHVSKSQEVDTVSRH